MSSNDDDSPRNVPTVSINIHTSTTFHGFKELKQKINCQNSTAFHDYKDEIHVLKIHTKNDKRRIHVYPPLNSKKRHKKRKDKNRLKHPIPTSMINSDEEERSKSIQEKVSKGIYSFTKYEERDIHERAEEYCRTISADKYHYVKPGDIGYDIQESSNLNGFHLNCPLPKKKKRRNYLTDSCYVTACDFHDPYDNTKMLPTGTRLLRPSGKLVQLVAKVLQESPDGLLQVPQIYAALQNMYPYFKYMDPSAINSWRSSVRHALYQKWFKKIKFTVPQICCKGSYWALNKDFGLPTTMTVPDNNVSDSIGGSNISYPKKKRRYRKKKYTGTCKMQFKANGELVEVTRKQDTDWNHNVGNSLQELLKIAKQYGLKISLTTTPIQEMTENNPICKGDPVLFSLPSASIEQAPTCIYGCDREEKQGDGELVTNLLQPQNSDSFVVLSSSKPCVPVLPRQSSTYTACQETLGNVQTIVANSETLYVNEHTDSFPDEDDFSVGGWNEETDESNDSEELLSALYPTCGVSDECTHQTSEIGEEGANIRDDFLPELDMFSCASDTANFDCFSLPCIVDNDFQSDTLDQLLSVLQPCDDQAEEVILENRDQVDGDSLFDISLINDDSFFQQCKFFD
ncbi:uncharacterized protein [Magallana gigas]|uniref:uncharacterized protein isoform X2 n=1 Tax=Magallana gigas TaxID=29159 RepID=UPI003340691B